MNASRIILGDVSDRSGSGDQALTLCLFGRLQIVVEYAGQTVRLEPVDIIEMHADDRAARRQFVRLPHESDQIRDDDLPGLGIVEIDLAFPLAPSVSRRLRGRKSIAIAADVAISSDMVDDQIDPRRHRRNGETGDRRRASLFRRARPLPANLATDRRRRCGSNSLPNSAFQVPEDAYQPRAQRGAAASPQMTAIAPIRNFQLCDKTK